MFAVQQELPLHIKDNIDRMTEEFIREEGYITCEFGATEENVIGIHRYIHEKNRQLPDYGMWRIFLCETCAEHHPKAPYHVDIMVIDERPPMKEA